MFGKFLQSPAQEEGGKEPGLFFLLTAKAQRIPEAQGSNPFSSGVAPEMLEF